MMSAAHTPHSWHQRMAVLSALTGQAQRVCEGETAWLLLEAEALVEMSLRGVDTGCMLLSFPCPAAPCNRLHRQWHTCFALPSEHWPSAEGGGRLASACYSATVRAATLQGRSDYVCRTAHEGPSVPCKPTAHQEPGMWTTSTPKLTSALV
jgi:hypothetical protein